MGAGTVRGGEHKRRSSHSLGGREGCSARVDDFTPLDGEDLERKECGTQGKCTKTLLHVRSQHVAVSEKRREVWYGCRGRRMAEWNT